MEKRLSFPILDAKQVTYYVYRESSVTTIKAYGFNIIDGVLMFTGKNKNLLRVFAAGEWKEIVLEGANDDTGY